MVFPSNNQESFPLICAKIEFVVLVEEEEMGELGGWFVFSLDTAAFFISKGWQASSHPFAVED